jgi:hypothetical protein
VGRRTRSSFRGELSVWIGMRIEIGIGDIQSYPSVFIPNLILAIHLFPYLYHTSHIPVSKRLLEVQWGGYLTARNGEGLVPATERGSGGGGVRNGRVSVVAQRTSIWAGRRAWGRHREREGKLRDSGWVALLW